MLLGTLLCHFYDIDEPYAYGLTYVIIIIKIIQSLVYYYFNAAPIYNKYSVLSNTEDTYNDDNIEQNVATTY